MDVVIRPVNDRFLDEVAFPAFDLGVRDAGAGLDHLLAHVRDDRTRGLVELLVERGAEGSFFTLQADMWLETVYRLLFWEWLKEPDGWTVSAEYAGFAGDFEQTLHLALMLTDKVYPYAERDRAALTREQFASAPDVDFGLEALIAGGWDPVPAFPPDQVLSTQGRAQYAPGEVAVSDWSYRPAQVVCAWNAELPDRLASLLGREAERLLPIEVPDAREILDYWLGRVPEPPALAVTFSGLGPQAHGWIREIGDLARQIRAAASLEQGLTSIVTQTRRQHADGGERAV